MARPLRIEFSGAFYHITARGNARSTIFLGFDDRRYWLSLLGEVCEQFKWRMNAARRHDGEIPTPQRSTPTPALPIVLKETTDLDATIRQLYRSGHYTQRQIAQQLGVHYATISRRLQKTAMLIRKT